MATVAAGMVMLVALGAGDSSGVGGVGAWAPRVGAVGFLAGDAATAFVGSSGWVRAPADRIGRSALGDAGGGPGAGGPGDVVGGGGDGGGGGGDGGGGGRGGLIRDIIDSIGGGGRGPKNRC